jgi:hypothetical protein
MMSVQRAVIATILANCLSYLVEMLRELQFGAENVNCRNLLKQLSTPTLPVSVPYPPSAVVTWLGDGDNLGHVLTLRGCGKSTGSRGSIGMFTFLSRSSQLESVLALAVTQSFSLSTFARMKQRGLEDLLSLTKGSIRTHSFFG